MKGFTAWMREVNFIIENKTGLSYNDLPDWDYVSAFEDEISPKDAASEALEDAGYDDAAYTQTFGGG